MSNGRHIVWMTHGPREKRRWRGFCGSCACQMCQRPAGRRSASGQCLKHHIQLLTCKRVLPCESMGVAGEARARVLRACRVRGGRVCWCASVQGAARRARAWRWRGRRPASPVRTCEKSGNRESGVGKNAKRAYIARSVYCRPHRQPTSLLAGCNAFPCNTEDRTARREI